MSVQSDNILLQPAKRNQCFHGEQFPVVLLIAVLLLLCCHASFAASDAETAIIAAATRGDTATVSRLLDTDSKLLKAVDAEYLATPLHWAAYRGQVAVVELLLNRGAAIGARNRVGQTPLHLAAVGNSAAAVTKLLAAGAPVNDRDAAGNTPLHYAVYQHALAAITVLLAAQASPAVQNATGVTALMLARTQAKQDAIDLLAAESAREQQLLQAETVPANGSWLDSLGAITPSRGALQLNNNVLINAPLTIGQLTFAHGLGPGVLREWTMPVPAGATQFWVMVSMNAAADAKSQARVILRTDDIAAAKTDILCPGCEPVLLAVNLAGKHSLTLAAENVGGDYDICIK